jgi:hypothetical protein
MVTDKEVATALGLSLIQYQNNLIDGDAFDLIKSAVRKKWCTENDRVICIIVREDRFELYLDTEKSSMDDFYDISESEFDCYKEALVWLDKKEKKNAPTT